MQDERSHRAILPAAAALAALLAALPAAAWWPEPALRSGPWLPPPRDLALSLEAGGAWVPRRAGLSTADTGLIQGRLTWNLAPWEALGLFGRHGMGGMRWGNLALLSSEHEAGLRWLVSEAMTLEWAYLGHRTERQWVEGVAAAVGGVRDHGTELCGWVRLDPHPRIGLDLRMLGRLFDVYRDRHGVLGAGARLGLAFADGHALVLDLLVLHVVRGDPRPGVDRHSWNVIGDLAWRSRISGGFGLMLGARLTTNLLVGEVPMLELRRSMIGEPMAMGFAGAWFSL